MNPVAIQGILDQVWFRFVLVGVLGFLTGLEFREYLRSKPRPQSIGTARTYTFIALLGFVLHLLDADLRLYLGGLLALVVWTGLFYYRKLAQGQQGILGLLIALLVYSYGAVIQSLPLWFLVLEFVSVVFVLNARPLTHRLTELVDRREWLTLAKFLLLAAVILPLMPDTPILKPLPTTPFRIWEAVVAISAISYLGYILQRYVFPHQGYLLTGLLGGLYSSTATTLVLARKPHPDGTVLARLNLAILAATGMMYLRLLALVLILNPAFLPALAGPFLILGLGTLGACLWRDRRLAPAQAPAGETDARNPLELGTAFLFAALFVLMLMLSKLVLQHYGNAGLQVLSFLVGFTDIDPFVLSLLKGSFSAASTTQLAAAIVIAAGSNNLLKALYVVLAGNRRDNRPAIIGLVILGVLTLAIGLFMGR